MARFRLLSLLALLSVVLALAPTVGCTAAPLEGKPCDCASGYTCCKSTNRCLGPNEACLCSSITLADPRITLDGHPLADEPPPTEVPKQLLFNAPSGQWVSYAFLSDDQDPTRQVLSTITPDRDGFHVDASFESATPSQILFEGFGLTYRSPEACVDGSAYTGVQFDFTGDLGGRLLSTSVASADDVAIQKDAARGTCLADFRDCYGPRYASLETNGAHPTPVRIVVPFELLQHGVPNEGLVRSKIVNVQWQLDAAPNAHAQFTIQNLTFY